MKRLETRKVMVKDLQIGNQNKVIIQSMCNIKTERVDEVVNQINHLASLGADLMRVSIMDENDAKAVKEIISRISIPLVGDIHFDYKLALLAIENGIHKIRINPGNIGSKDKVISIIEAAKKHHVAIRIGVNSGSLDKETLQENDDQVTAKGMVDLLEKYVAIFEDQQFYDLVLSLKASDVLTTISAYQLCCSKFAYPLHLGITEAGGKEIGLIRSAAGLAPLLLNGLGDTIRISLSDDPEEEIVAAKRLLHDLKLYPNYPTLISCPTCGRTQVDIVNLSRKVLPLIEQVKKPITVAIMGCIVNGPGEAKHADIGLAGGNNEFVLFKKGKIIKKIGEEEAIGELLKEIENL